MRPTIDRLLDAIAPLGRADLVASITSVYPVQVICGIAGVPLEDAAQFAQWAEQINMGPLFVEQGMAASKAMADYLRPLVEARRAEPNGDFLSDLVHEEVDGEQLTDSKIYGFLRLLLPAGAETTFRVMGNCLHALLSHPDDLARVYADRTLLADVVEETLRWETSVTQVSRVATRDTEVAGCPIAAGSPVGVITASANHDETRWDDADEWKLGRPVQHHLAFGTGPHQCLGMHLARLELRVGLDRILDRLPDLRFDPAGADEAMIEGYAFRGPRSLPVLVHAQLSEHAARGLGGRIQFAPAWADQRSCPVKRTSGQCGSGVRCVRAHADVLTGLERGHRRASGRRCARSPAAPSRARSTRLPRRRTPSGSDAA